ncbi:MAG: aldehyde dehydrogenase family protein [Myxococcales bacterium]|nr:aldehyde dehydrogenase family protein [Myxococcales bacterium]
MESRPHPLYVAAQANAATIPCFDPATGEPLGEVANVGGDEVRARIARARAAQERWAETTFDERREVLRAILRHLLDHTDELCRVIAQDAGKTLENAILGEIWPVCEKLRYTIAHGEAALRPRRVSPGLLVHKTATVEYHPKGVVGVICPWNFPLQNVLGPTIPALFAGNAVIVKVSEWTAWSAPRFQQIFDEALDAAGMPRDLVQVIAGYAETGKALVGGGVDLIIFTGSMPNGKRVLEASAATLTPVILELGGKDPMIICDDADLERAVHAALAGTFIASGQMCLAAERIYVHRGIYDRFVERVVEIAGRLRQAPPLTGPEPVDVGAMTMPGQVDIVERLVQDAVAKGARVRVGGRRSDQGEGSFFAPTVLTDVDHSMDIVRHETFGPVMSIIRFDDDDDAVRMANATDYGLGSTVFSRDPTRAHRIARKLRAGSTTINDFSMAYMANELPFGGVGGSGFGRLNGVEGIRACCDIKSVLDDRMPGGRPARLYPVAAGDYERAKAAIRTIYGRGVRERVGGVVDLVRRFFGG